MEPGWLRTLVFVAAFVATFLAPFVAAFLVKSSRLLTRDRLLLAPDVGA